MARINLTSMSIDALLKLRDDVGKALTRKAGELRNQLALSIGVGLGPPIGIQKGPL